MSKPTPDIRLRLIETLNPRWFFISLFTVTLWLVAAGVLSQISKYRLGWSGDWVDLFDLNRELNIPTWYSGALLLLSALLLYLVGLIDAAHARHWKLIALVFTYLSLDEVAGLHERLDPVVKTIIDTRGVFYFGWVAVAIPILALLGVIFGRFILQLEAKTKKRFLVAAVVFVGGALVMEMAGGLYATKHGQDNLTFAALTIVEEFMEMFGLVIFITGLGRSVRCRLVENVSAPNEARCR